MIQYLNFPLNKNFLKTGNSTFLNAFRSTSSSKHTIPYRGIQIEFRSKRKKAVLSLNL